MHRVLARQMRRMGLNLDEPPGDTSTWKLFLEKIEGFYDDADRNRYRTERSLRVSSDELLRANQELAEMSRARIERSEAHYKDLFRQGPIPTWEEDFTRAFETLEELRDAGVTDLAALLQAEPRILTDIISSVVVTDVNPAVARLIRSDDSAALMGPIHPSLVAEQNTSAWIEQLMTLWNAEGSLRINHLVGVRADGEVFHGILEWHAPRVGDVFDYSRVVVSIIDITDRIAAEERMQNILKSKDEFLASISHELRTPLTSVLGFAEVLRSMDDGSEEEKESLLEIIATQAGDLSNIVEDLLVAARAELGQLSVVSVPIDVHAQVAQVIEGRSRSLRPVRIPDRPPTPIKAVGDPERVRQILRNLTANAERYGGDEISVDVVENRTAVQVRVCDNGVGLSTEQRERVFERYYRASPESGQPGSVGIGLTISRDLARMMGGDLYYDYQNGLSTFTLDLVKV